MTFADKYPKLNQWASYGGTIEVKTKGDMSISDFHVEVAVGDAGGVPEECRFLGSTVDEALASAEKGVERWLAETRKLLDELMSGELKDTEHEFLMVAGWPPVKNPFFGG